MGFFRRAPKEASNDSSESEVKRLSDELVEMDAAVVAYLKDPVGQPTPDFERLVSRIQSLRERPEFENTLTLKISNIMHKALYFERGWRQIRENVAEVEAAKARGEQIPQERRKETYFCAPTQKRKGRLEAKGIKVVDMPFDMQAMKLKEHGVASKADSVETKAQFKARVTAQYRRIKAQGLADKKVVLVWNEAEKCCDLIVDRRV
jgi:hypothetical protein